MQLFMHSSIVKMWIERCSICHEITSSIIRIEYYENLKNNVHCVFNSQDFLPPDLEIHRDKVDTITLELFRVFS